MIRSKRKPLTFFPLVMDDYRADTLHLTTEQHGAYLLALMRYFELQSPLPEVEIRRASLLSDAGWAEHRDVLAAFFVIDGGLWKHKRVERDLVALRKQSIANSKNGAKGGKASGEARRAKRNEATASNSLKRNGKRNEAEKDGLGGETASATDLEPALPFDHAAESARVIEAGDRFEADRHARLGEHPEVLRLRAEAERVTHDLERAEATHGSRRERAS